MQKIEYDLKGISLRKRYSYDKLDRLIKVDQIYDENFVGESNWNYDSIGNMLSSSDIYQKSYSYDTKNPQQAIKIGDDDIIYDNYGRVTKTSSYGIEWYSFSQPNTITTKTNEKFSFEYGPDYERISKITKNTKIVYLDEVYEKITNYYENGTTEVVEKYNIKVLNKLIAQKIVFNRKNSQTFFLEKMHSD